VHPRGARREAAASYQTRRVASRRCSKSPTACGRSQLVPKHGINAYLMGDVIVDAGIPRSGRRIVQQLEGRPLTAHALTHAHPDHAGGSDHVTKATRSRAGRAPTTRTPSNPASRRSAQQPAEARDGAKELDGRPGAAATGRGRRGAGFTVLDAPGHSPGHIVFWREADRVLVTGDVFFNLHLPTLRPGLREPIKLPTVDPARNRESMRRLAALQPATVVFGHGPR
jgi:glyoxylase-like metal-dependent hydrolase (beta-lactamase superfamily II)